MLFRSDAITSAKRTIGDLNAAIADSTARISALSAEGDELAQKISAAEGDLQSATGIRDSERGDFEAAEKELVETVDTLGRAVIVLKRGQMFLQGKQKDDVAKLASGLKQIIEASWVTSKQKAVVQSLLQSEDEDLSLQPQATAASYSSQGGGILDVLGDMKDKAEIGRASCRERV